MTQSSENRIDKNEPLYGNPNPLVPDIPVLTHCDENMVRKRVHVYWSEDGSSNVDNYFECKTCRVTAEARLKWNPNPLVPNILLTHCDENMARKRVRVYWSEDGSSNADNHFECKTCGMTAEARLKWIS